MIILVACADVNMGIGNAEGQLLFDLPKDMARFKSITVGKHVVMGRKTWDSLPVKPLPKRKNYVLTNDESFEVKGKTKVLNSIAEVLDMAKSKDVYVIGGGEIYKQLMPYADKIMITHVHTVDLEARVFFPEIAFDEWKLVKVQQNQADEKHAHKFTFANYERKAPKIIEVEKVGEQQEEDSTQE